MNSLFNTRDTTGILQRINEIKPETQGKWGRMDAAQMLAHCAIYMEAATGKRITHRMLIGRLLGRILRPKFSSDKPFRHGSPTANDFKVTGQRDFNSEKEKLTRLIVEFAEKGPAGVTTRPHPFFGRLKADEWGEGSYKHIDHHLKQFGI